MECSRTRLHDLNLASRKAEEAATRRFHAVEWLESLVGPLGLTSQPSEREFISCLRNGSILCNAINKIQPGAVPKVVENYSHLQSLTRECQPPAAYQYFENVRNFLVAVEELKLPAFEASVLERDSLESGSVGKVVDCILALKAHHEGKQTSSGNGYHKHAKSPHTLHSANRIHARGPPDCCRRLETSSPCDGHTPIHAECHKIEDAIAKLLIEHCVIAKENIDENLLTSFRKANQDSSTLFKKIVSRVMNEQFQHSFPEIHSMFKSYLQEGSNLSAHFALAPLQELPIAENSECCRACLRHGSCNHKSLLESQRKELLDLKVLLSETKRNFGDLQLQLQQDFRQIENQVSEMSTAALGYRKVVLENRKLYNMVQDLKGSIRVFCRVRPTFSSDTRSIIDFIGEDGSLVILDPRKANRKVFQFNRIFGPTSTQAEVYRDTQPLIRSVMDGYNVCIFAYGQTGSGKTYTMSGPCGGSSAEMGINYLALNDLFHICEKRKGIITYNIHVQMIEIYNEQVRDLLGGNSLTTKLEIRSCPNEDGLSLPDAKMHPVQSPDDVLKLMELGEVNRAVSSTAMNNRSSRSHSVLMVHVRGKDTSGGTLRSCLHLVDLAGSERVDKSEVVGERLREAQYINKSLSCLGDAISALAQKNSHIPYRNSKLTLLLQDSLGGQAKTLMFAHLSPEEDSFGETISTLNFAQRVSAVEVGPARAQRESGEVMQLKEQIENLKRALANKERQNFTNGSGRPAVTTQRTPPRTRRLSIENKERQNVTNGSARPVYMIERTPPRPRRLIIENSTTGKTEKGSTPGDRTAMKTPSGHNHVRRLSLEGRRNPRKDDACQSTTLEAVSTESPTKNAEVSSGILECMGNGEPMIEVYHLKASRSPTSSYQKRAVKLDSRSRIPQIQIPQAPGLDNVTGNAIQTVTNGDATDLADSQTYGKKSQIRKSLKTIGKLINGSDKRNQKAMKEQRSPIKGKLNTNETKSPLAASARTLRRQSLTGIQASGTDRSRRSSIGGKPVETGSNDVKNSKTPPRTPGESAKTTRRRWL